MNAQQEINLRLLANWLLDNAEHLEKEGAFSMDMYRQDRVNTRRHDVRFKSTTDCGSVGCALGWAPLTAHKALAHIDEDFIGETGLDFELYCDRVFGLGYTDYAWNFMFSEGWVYYDNTAKGAGIRILFFLEMGINHIPPNIEPMLESPEGSCREDLEELVELYNSWFLEDYEV